MMLDPRPRLAYTIYAPACMIAPQQPSTQSNPVRRQIFEALGIKNFKSPPTLLDEAAIKRTSEPSKPSRFTTFDEACQYPEAKQSLHHGQAGPVRMVKAGGMAFFPANDAAAFKPKAVLSNALVPSVPAPTAEALGSEPPCAAVSPAVMTPKSYAAVVKASVSTTAPAQPAAVPKFSAAVSMPSSDVKPSAAASQLAEDTTSLKVKDEISMSMHVHVCMCMSHVMCVCVCVCMCMCIRMCTAWIDR